MPRRSGVSVFAVEDSSAQLTWRSLPVGTVLSLGRATAVVEQEGPGAAVLDGLPPDTVLVVRAAAPGRRPRAGGRVRTLAPPPGRELCRVATVSDCHLGGDGFGHLPRSRHPSGPGIHARCLAAAVTEAVAWGASLLVVKGDVTQSSGPDEWAEAAARLAPAVAAGVPVEVIPGNHDRRGGEDEAVAGLAAVGARLTLGGVACRDLPGLRVLCADVTVPGHHHGLAAPVRDELAALAAEAPAGVLVALHQHPQRRRRTTSWPPGLPGPDAAALLDALAAANPATLVTAGHTHRHRRRTSGPVVVTQVGSTKDHPGTWAGYAVHEGGIRQVVRRVADPEVLAWTDATGRAYLGAWGAWSTGTRAARCFSHTWPARP